MANYYQITLNQGRTDTVVASADSLNDIKTFFQTVSTASITFIKKIVFSKDLGVGSATSSYIPNSQNSFIRITARSKKGYVDTFNISFPKKNLTNEKIIKTVKKNLTINSDPIIEVINIIVADEGLAPTVSQ